MERDRDEFAQGHFRLPCGSLQQAKSAFLAQHSGSYGYNGWVDSHWQQEVGVRMLGHHYLDYTGAGQYTTSQVAAALQELQQVAFGNPHSRNPSSARATQEVAGARALILQHFNADPEEYMVVFTKGATEGLKMVGEYFPWQQQARSGKPEDAQAYIYTQANHKSVLGIAAYARQHGTQLHCITREHMEAWLNSPPGTSVAAATAAAHSGIGKKVSSGHASTGGRGISLTASSGSSSTYAGAGDGQADKLDVPRGQATELAAAAAAAAAVAPSSTPVASAAAAAAAAAAPAVDQIPTAAKIDLAKWRCGSTSGGAAEPDARLHLVAFPAKDNYEGQLYPLKWVEQVHARSDSSNRYYVVLDVAAFAATHPLDLSRVKPDFVPVSFYKLFGYPSGLGALLVRRQAAHELCRGKIYFGGGSVDYCTAEDAWHILSEPPAGLEDGTLGYLNIAAIKHGFKLLNDLGGMKAIASHVESLRLWTYQQLVQLQHSNGKPLLRLFGRHAEGPAVQCGIFQFQVLTPAGERVPGGLVEAAATAAGLHLRTGCNCNPGRCLANLGITPEEERARAAQRHKGPVLIVLRPRQSSSSGGPSSSATTDSASATDAAPAVSSPCAAATDRLTAGEPATGSVATAGYYQARQARSAVPVPLPLGSVRVSLGSLSTFEDCYALVRFLAATFRNFEIYERDVEAGVKLLRVLDDEQHQTDVTATIITSSAGGAATATACTAAGKAAGTAEWDTAGDENYNTTGGALGELEDGRVVHNAAGIRAAVRAFWNKWGDISSSQQELWLATARQADEVP